MALGWRHSVDIVLIFIGRGPPIYAQYPGSGDDATKGVNASATGGRHDWAGQAFPIARHLRPSERIIVRFILVVLAIAWSQPGFAQDAERPAGALTGPRAPDPAGWSVTIGVAPILSPAWQGSRDMAFSIFPDLRVNYDDTLFASVPDGLGWNAVNENGWKAGPLAKIRFGRDEDDGGSPFLVAGGSDALRGLGDIGATAELGGFVEKRLGARRQWRLRAEVRRGFGGHEGVVADASLAYQLRQGRTIINVGPRLSAASGNFMQTYFGISSQQSERSGLAPYRARGGLLSYGLGGSLVRPLDERSAVTVFTGVDRLGGQAARSPLVRERGRRTQFSIGLGYGYRFGL